MKQYFVYQTKCRRCHGLIETAWPINDRDNIMAEWKKMRRFISESMSSATIEYCEYCERNTIQDYVSYEDSPSK